MFLFITLSALVLLFGLLAYLYRRPLPKVDGTLKIDGLSAPVEIIRDRWGVPHIYAHALDDLLFAQGYVHAQDRLWQMELNRRIGHGRLSEMVGEIAFTTDKFLRTMGLARAARADWERADAESKRALEVYARGVNAYAQNNPPPLEFTLLGIRWESWTPVDSMAWIKVMALGLSSNWDNKLVHAALIAKLGAERAAQLHGDYLRTNPVVLPDQTVLQIIERIREQFRAAEKWLPLSAGGMSNNWVIDGSKSSTGKPLLANDPHLALQMPAIWYENHLDAPELQVAGVSFPGVPGVILGHNAEIAWGFTNSFADVQDVYLEKFKADDPTRYEYRGAWEQATIAREEIRVKGEKTPRVVEVVSTRQGPLIGDLVPASLSGATVQYALALRWTAHEESYIVRALLNLNRARNWDDFANALCDFDAPSQNIVYADRAGNIGFYMPGKVPIRAKGIGAVPVPGWTGEYEWVGWIPHEELPHAFNPAQHYLATANNQVAGQAYPHFLGAETSNGFRARRVVELLTQQEKLAADDFARMHVDLYCAPAQDFCQLLTARADNLLSQPALGDVQTHARHALDALKRWDHHLTAVSVAGAVYELTQYFALRRVFEPWLGEWTDHYIGIGVHPLLMPLVGLRYDQTPLVLQRILANDERAWFKDAQGKAITREEILAGALADAIGYLRKAVGDDVARWQWGKIHTAGFNHLLGAQKPLDKIFSRGPFPYGGDANTVWQAAYIPKLPIQAEGGFTASWRQIMDVSDWDASRGVITTGQSGHPASGHYADMIPMWLNGEYHPLLWSREKVEAHAAARLRLETP